MAEKLTADVAVIGAGPGGSLMALLLNRIGLRAALFDRGCHPRFAIGESSTPTADLVLRDLSQRYDLPCLEPLSRYGTWKANYPHLVCGLKRGFSFFHQQPNQRFAPSADHRNELLLAANSEDARADTHWLRWDVDAYLVEQVRSAGIPYFDRTELSVQEIGWPWRLAGLRERERLAIEVSLLIDGTGEAGFVPRALGLAGGAETMQTQSRALFAHFADVAPWHDVLAGMGADLAAHPFRCDAAALHHLLDEGWMWQLRFDNGVTSAGFAVDSQRHPLDASISPQQEWDELLARYPSIGEQFAAARLVAPESGLCRTGRLQRRWMQAAGADWALLPHTAGFVDPLFSTGLAHTFCGVERLVHILERHWRRESLAEQLRRYATTVQAELGLIDELVRGSYLAMRDFDLFTPFAMLYFAAATSYEHRRLSGKTTPAAAFLCADDRAYCMVVRQIRQRLTAALSQDGDSRASEAFFQEVAQAIEPFNLAGLCDPDAANMYRHTALTL